MTDPDATPGTGSAEEPVPGSLEDEAAAARDAAAARPEGLDVTDPSGDPIGNLRSDIGGDISGVDNWLEEGGPLEDADLAAGGDASDEVSLLRTELAERTLDLQRLQAEYVNYRRRVERDRELVKQNATYAALAPITEVLDTIDRAREHGEVEGGFKTVADQLERVVAAVGLVKFGAVGDPFDPNRHEALSSMGPDPEGVATVTTVKVIAKSGYAIGERVVRAAQVLTVEPAE